VLAQGRPGDPDRAGDLILRRAHARRQLDEAARFRRRLMRRPPANVPAVLHHGAREESAERQRASNARRRTPVITSKTSAPSLRVWQCYYSMFVRFQRQWRRLNAGLVQTRREAGRVRTEFIGMLGSVDADVSVRERLVFWAKLPERLARLGNRVDPEEHAKIYGALHARIPMVTPDEQRAIQEENAKADERFWDTLRGLNASQIEDYKRHVALAEKKIAETEPEVAKAAEKVEIARSRLERLRRGEDVAGGLGKPFGYDDMIAVLKSAGFTPRDFRRLKMAGSLTKAELEVWLKHIPAEIEAGDRARDRELRRIIRARTRRPNSDTRKAAAEGDGSIPNWETLPGEGDAVALGLRPN
jgi:hypothetical protein